MGKDCNAPCDSELKQLLDQNPILGMLAGAGCVDISFDAGCDGYGEKMDGLRDMAASYQADCSRCLAAKVAEVKAVLGDAFDEEYAEGYKREYARGFAEGYVIGFTQGLKEARMETAKRMLDDGRTDDYIMEKTHITNDELEKMKQGEI